ncbi:hypothetical protein HOP52_19215 [Halomonas campisalis]|uniref:ATP-grasp domain-containing protein n=1 Tax=Billgrantia campisalis TaxID=74661 RepID=A0ABS9PDZ6_9GAMM|nr:hypothetical protein [Halomonas campisalis]MCG6659876.1 hypothetical protein [Halomonas campisalis]MDR5865068.1 hypothetical protein [Halomonas campisalis]
MARRKPHPQRKAHSASASRTAPAPAAAKRPSADFTDSVMKQRLHAIPHLGSNAYLLALAAWQRGLKVTFHYEMASHCPRFAHLPFSGYRGEFLTIGDGRRHHAFYRVMGDRTTQQASAACESKPHTLDCWRQAGLPVADGQVIEVGHAAEAEPLLARHPQGRFILKPVAGTLAQGIHRRLSADQVRDLLNAASEPLLLEEYVEGTEYRVFVTAGRVVAARIRRPACILGDGTRTIAECVAHKVAQRRQHPVYGQEPFGLDEVSLAFLAQQGRSPGDVPAPGEVVYLNDIPDTHLGGDLIDGDDRLPSQAASIAIQATAALGLPHAGLDMLVCETDSVDAPRVVLLEANQNPYIQLSTVPMPGILPAKGNRIAESIIDDYFPSSVTRPRFPRASFDFTAICQMLTTGIVSEVSLPVLGADWVHERLTLPATQVDQAIVDRIHQVRLRHGLHVQLVKSETGDVIVDAVAPRERWARFCAQALPERAASVSTSTPPSTTTTPI